MFILATSLTMYINYILGEGEAVDKILSNSVSNKLEMKPLETLMGTSVNYRSIQDTEETNTAPSSRLVTIYVFFRARQFY